MPRAGREACTPSRKTRGLVRKDTHRNDQKEGEERKEGRREGEETLDLDNAAIGDAGLVALAPALRRRPALEALYLGNNPFGDEGLAALVAPPLPAGAPPPTTAGLAKLKRLDLDNTQVTDVGCAALAAALDSGALPALEVLDLDGTPAGAVAKGAMREAMSRAACHR